MSDTLTDLIARLDNTVRIGKELPNSRPLMTANKYETAEALLVLACEIAALRARQGGANG